MTLKTEFHIASQLFKKCDPLFKQRTIHQGMLLVLFLVLVVCSGCTSKTVSGNGQSQGSTAAGSNGTVGSISVMCNGDKINNPPEAFHYSYTHTDATGTVNKEADITPQTMAITITDQSGAHSFHGVRSDDLSWNNAVLDLTGSGLTKMSANIDSLSDGYKSSFTNLGLATVNGYDTTKYAIDTGNANSTDKQRYDALFGKGSYEKGTVWVAADSCAVKLSLDEGMWQSNGSVKSGHFELARTKK